MQFIRLWSSNSREGREAVIAWNIENHTGQSIGNVHYGAIFAFRWIKWPNRSYPSLTFMLLQIIILGCSQLDENLKYVIVTHFSFKTNAIFCYCKTICNGWATAAQRNKIKESYVRAFWVLQSEHSAQQHEDGYAGYNRTSNGSVY